MSPLFEYLTSTRTSIQMFTVFVIIEFISVTSVQEYKAYLELEYVGKYGIVLSKPVITGLF